MNLIFSEISEPAVATTTVSRSPSMILLLSMTVLPATLNAPPLSMSRLFPVGTTALPSCRTWKLSGYVASAAICLLPSGPCPLPSPY
jgi:hypothetical protein